MVKSFQFSRLPKILFRQGALEELPRIIKQYGNEILLVTGKSSFMQSVHYGRLSEDLRVQGIIFHLVQIGGEPSPDVVDSVIRQYSSKHIDLVAGIGGGSVLDAGKAIAAMMYRSEPVSYFLEVVGTRQHPGTTLPFIAVPTTSGTGSEATKNAVLSSVGENGFKRSLRHDNFVPAIALVDPSLTINCPKNITAASGMDCFTQLLESYLSDKAVEYTDALALEGLKAIKTSLLRAYQDGTDIEARKGISFAALTSGICLANAGLGSVHGFASSVGALFDIPHGVICGTLMAKANELNVRELRRNTVNKEALMKYSLLGELFSSQTGKNDDFYIDFFISHLEELTEKLKIPKLSEYDVTKGDLGKICKSTDIKNNPVKLSYDQLAEILTARI